MSAESGLPRLLRGIEGGPSVLFGAVALGG